MESNARMLKPEVFLCTMRYTKADRSQAEPLGPAHWINAERAYAFTQGKRYSLEFYEQPELTGEYVVADPPLVGRESHKTDEGTIIDVPTVTVYMALEELWEQMKPTPEQD